jgi:hypothetical protein
MAMVCILFALRTLDFFGSSPQAFSDWRLATLYRTGFRQFYVQTTF